MKQAIYLCPIGQDTSNFENTVLKKVDIADDSSEDKTTNFQRVWGFKGEEKKINNNDLLFFISRGTAIGVGLVSSYYIDEQLSKRIWSNRKKNNDEELDIWSNILQIKDFKKINIENFLSLLGYNEAYTVRTFTRVNPNRVDRILSTLALEFIFNEEI